MNIELTEIQITPIRPREGLLAFCNFIINGSFFVGDVGIHSRFDGTYRLVYPSKTLLNGVTINVFHPINSEVGVEIEKQVQKAYEELLLKRRV